jgi:hypothetical protein
MLSIRPGKKIGPYSELDGKGLSGRRKKLDYAFGVSLNINKDLSY